MIAYTHSARAVLRMKIQRLQRLLDMIAEDRDLVERERQELKELQEVDALRALKN